MDHHDRPETGDDRINVKAHRALIDAVDTAAGLEGVSRAHLARRILAERMRADGFLKPDAPASLSEARRRPPP